MIAALITAGAGALAIVALVAWLAHTAIARTDRAAAADVARALLEARVQLAEANVATHQRALAAIARERDAYQEIARASSAAPLPAGVDGLLLAIDAYRSLVPAEPAAGSDRPAGDGGGLPGGAAPADRPGDAGDDAGPATVPETGRIADVLK